MSNTIDTNLKVYQYEDPLLDVEARPVYSIKRSAQNYKIRRVEAYQFTQTGNQINFVYNPPQNHVISRNIRQLVEFEFVFSGDDQGSPLIQLGSNDSFQCLEYGISSANLTIDNGDNQYRAFDEFPLMHRYMSTKDLNENMGYTFNTPDLLSNYSDFTTVGSAYNVNSSWGEQGFGDDNLHGRYLQSQITVVENTNTNARIRVRFVTPIFLKPLTYKNNNHMMKGLFGVERLIYDVQFKQDLYKWVWAHSDLGNTILDQNVSYSIVGTPALLVQEYNPQP